MSRPSRGPPPSERPEHDPRVGTVLADRYRLDALLGIGGMGRVYAGEHVLMRKKVAVKVLHRELTSVPDVVARFEREAMAAANIEHPNVAAATDFGKLPDGAVFMVMEYVEGKNLRDEIAAGPVSVERAVRIMRQMASALASAHALNIVHRDLKPENVMLVAKGSEADFVKVLDFGIARVPLGEPPGSGGKAITKVGMVFGTPEYMAPEQALGQVVDGRADLYGLGVILFELLAGVRPFSSATQTGILGQQLSKPVPYFHQRAPGLPIPPAVEAVVRRLLEREVSERYQRAEDLVAALDALLGASSEGGRLFTQVAGTQETMVAGSLPSFIESPLTGIGTAGDQVRVGSSPESSQAGPSVPLPLGAPEVTAGRPTGAGPRLAAWLAAVWPQPEETGLRSWLSRLPGPVLARLDQLGLRRPLLPGPGGRRLSPLALLGFLALLGVGGGLITLILARATTETPVDPVVSAPSIGPRPEPSVSTVVRPLRAPGPELDLAKREGAGALAKLAQRFPRDAGVRIELAKAYRLERRFVDAVAAMGEALAMDPSLRQAPESASVLWQTAQPSESREASFKLLQGPMGTKGADIIYDLTTTATVSAAVKERGQAYLKSKEFEAHASPALRVAVKLRFAETCQAAYRELEAAKKYGDERALPSLRKYEYTKGCRRRRRKIDCYPCMRQDAKLVQAIQAITDRVKKR